MSIDWLEPHFFWCLVAVLGWWGYCRVRVFKTRPWRIQDGLRLLIPIALILGLAHPVTRQVEKRSQTFYAVDVSKSVGDLGLEQAWKFLNRLQISKPNANDSVECWIFAEQPKRVDWPMDRETWLAMAKSFRAEHGNQTHFTRLVESLNLRVPAAEKAALVVLTDGVETRGYLEQSKVLALAPQLQFQVKRLHGASKEGIWLQHFWNDRAIASYRAGESLRFKSEIQSTKAGKVTASLYQDDRKIETKSHEFRAAGQAKLDWEVTATSKGFQRYRLEIEGEGVFPERASAEQLVEVKGPLRILWLDEEIAEERAQRVGLPVRPEQMELHYGNLEIWPNRLESLASYDAVVLASVSANRLGPARMEMLREYVERLGGGLLMLGGAQSYALGGYLGTPLEDMLPLYMQGKDQEEKQNSALALVIDRSGSMAGEKLEMAKSASLASAQVLTSRDFLGVFAFDNDAHTIVPMLRIGSRSSLQKQIASLQSGGGTHLMPAVKLAQDALLKTPAKIRHVIVLSDGQTTGDGYESVVTQMKGQGISLSTVSVGEGAHVDFLQTLADLGGGNSYAATEVSQVMGFFTQDTLRHTGRMIHEEPVLSKWVKGHRLMEAWGEGELGAPPLLGYVLTQFRPGVDRIMETASGDPLLASWQVGLGRVSAFTSHANSNWSVLWRTRWPKYHAFWAEIIRQTARPHDAEEFLELESVNVGDSAILRVRVDPRLGGARLDQAIQSSAVIASWFPQKGARVATESTQLPVRRSGIHELEVELPSLEEGAAWFTITVGDAKATLPMDEPSRLEVESGWVDETFLQRLVKSTKGKWLENAADVTPVFFDQESRRSLQRWCLGIALGLYVVELICRRVRRQA